MSQQTVGLVVDRLLSDEDLRRQFAVDPLETIVGLHLRGLPLTTEEIDTLVRTNVRLWFWADVPMEGQAH